VHTRMHECTCARVCVRRRGVLVTLPPRFLFIFYYVGMQVCVCVCVCVCVRAHVRTSVRDCVSV